jgi:hypothetical protein
MSETTEATSALVSGLALSTGVEYRDRDGRRKAAFIVATPETIGDMYDAQSGTSRPEPGTVHLMVFSFTGNHYIKHNVPLGEGPTTFSVR